jgi:dienelactone hydrolase
MITTSEVSYDTDGLTMVAHLARPGGEGPWPAVLIGHDGIGLHDYQRRRADHLAEHGYLALAMDYHGGQLFIGEPEAMLARVMPLIADPARMQNIGRAALDVLLAVPGADLDRLAALGYGAGGSIVLELARVGVPFKAVAVVHPGLPNARSGDWTNLTGPCLICTGSEDPICTPDQVLAFARALQDAGVDWRANIYGGAKHAFWAQPTNPDGTPTGTTTHANATVPGVGYHPAHTARAWRAVLDLFDETIGTSLRRSERTGGAACLPAGMLRG